MAALLGCATMLSPCAAQAQAARSFDLPAQPLVDALLSAARQAGVSIGARDLARCAPLSRPVRGRMSVDQALSRLLAGSGCGFRAVDAQTYTVEPARSQPIPPPAPDPAPEDEPPPPPNLLESVVVSAAKRDVLVGRTPYAVSVLAARDLRVAGVTETADVADQFAGLITTNLGAGRDKLFVRGLSDGAFTGRTQSTVGLYLDDVPITYSAPNPDLLLTDVDRVELLRGPQGTLYGVGSIGGVLRIVTNQPDTKAWHASAGLTASFTDEGRPSTTATGMVNVPLAGGRAAIRLVGYDNVEGGYLDNPGLGLRDVNRTSRRGVRVSASGSISPQWRVTAGFTEQALDSADGQYVQSDLGPLQRGTAVREPHDNDFRQVSATLEGRGGWGGLKVSAGYVLHDYDTRYDASPTLGMFGQTPGAAAYDEENHVEFLVGEAVLTSPEDRRLQGLAGAFFAHAVQESAYTLSPILPAAPPAYQERRKDGLREAALFGEVSYALTDRLRITAGARAFAATLHTGSTRPGGTIAAFSGRLDKTDVSPKLVLSYQATSKALFYAQAAEGYRLGGFNTSGPADQVFSPPGGLQPTRAYGPDELWSYELGAKLALFKSRLQLQAAGFYALWRDVQTDQFLDSGLPFTANIGRAANRGVELEAAYRIQRNLTVKANLLVNEPEVVRADPTFAGRRGAALPGVPELSAGAAADYDHRLFGRVRWNAHAQFEYVGRSRVGFGPISGPAMGGYVTNRVSAGLAGGRWRLQAFVENLTNSRADTFSFGNPFNYLQTRHETPLRPRTAGINLAAEF